MQHHSSLHRRTDRQFFSYSKDALPEIKAEAFGKRPSLVLYSQNYKEIPRYKLHSTRGASASKANSVGLSVNFVMRHAKWRSPDSFAKFYNKEISHPLKLLCTNSVFSTSSSKIPFHTHNALYNMMSVVWNAAMEEEMNEAILEASHLSSKLHTHGQRTKTQKRNEQKRSKRDYTRDRGGEGGTGRLRTWHGYS